MDKETLSNYGWIVICVMVLAVMLALASPFGNFIADAIKSTTQGLFDTNQKALQSANINIMQQEFETMLNGNNGTTVPNGFTYTDAVTGEVLASGQQMPSKIPAGSQLTHTEGDYIYTLMQDGFETLEEARAYYKIYVKNQSGMTWEEFKEYHEATEEEAWSWVSALIEVGLTEDTFIPKTNPQIYWSVAVKDRTKTSYGQFYVELLDYSVTDMNSCYWMCGNLTTAPNIPNCITNIWAAFGECTSLTSVSLPNSLTCIGMDAFHTCTNLQSITIPGSVTSIDDTAFYQCTSLTNITFTGTMAQWNEITFGSNWNTGVPATYVQCSDGQVSLS